MSFYGPLSYHSLTRVYPRERLRKPFEGSGQGGGGENWNGSLTRRHRVIPALFPPVPRPPLVPPSANPLRLLREDWEGEEGQQRLATELYAVVKAIPTLAPKASRIISTDWSDLRNGAQATYAVLQGFPGAGRVMRTVWVNGKMMSEELYAIFKSAK